MYKEMSLQRTSEHLKNVFLKKGWRAKVLLNIDKYTVACICIKLICFRYGIQCALHNKREAL